MKDQLDKADSRILGVVLNKVEINSRGYYGHYGRYYGKYYGKYYGNYGEENTENYSKSAGAGGSSKKSAAAGNKIAGNMREITPAMEEDGDEIEYIKDI